jgi:hypothetical protein
LCDASRAPWLIAAIACTAACADRGQSTEDRQADARPAAPAAEAPEPAASDPCAAEREAVEAAPPDPEIAAYYAAVPRIALRAKLVPVLYASAPAPPLDPRAAAIRDRLDGAGAVAERVLRQELKAAAGDRALLRGALLRDGYLFFAHPEVAVALVKVLEIADLFDDEVVFRDRGDGLERLSRTMDGYVDEGGARADLLLNDRLARSEAELSVPRHYDLRSVRRASGADRVTPLVVGTDRAVVRLVYPTGWATEAVLSRRGFRTEVSCIEGAPATVEAERKKAETLRAWRDRVRDAAASMVAERPGFDEPSDEIEGEQEDGVLRHEWLKAYYRREKTFFYREREYSVFDRRGNPTPPEVCIDFIFDTWERASGNWFEQRGHRAGRTRGFLDFGVFPGLWRRHIPSILELAAQGGPPLVRYDLPTRDAVPLRSFGAMAEALARNADAFLEGDILVIHGLREEDQEEHYHAVLVLDADPLTGLPMVIADNAGRPRIRSLAAAMRSAPRRAVKHRLRLDTEWLLGALGGSDEIDAGRVVDGGARP